ncbi:hypothetical protein ANCCEY_01384 [Ancylostoma ceylanicum]|uniref:Methyltransferase FkbM domain-containing protein n=1 Tax=Ancylostoma ceylanicum TaxID=53326 RepID=A0A0D6M5Y4_9BILA|nr:hypothetical protein ANCCEY_01384 [Ancylostoma ceylanicum]
MEISVSDSFERYQGNSMQLEYCLDANTAYNTVLSIWDDRRREDGGINNKTPSVVITLGVGWDVLAEQKLKKILPNGTLFFGADPMYEENAALYSTVGQFFPLAIGNETKLSKAFVMPKQLKGKYVFQTMVHLDVITFLTKLTRTPIIDQFLMDNEGPEYDLLPMMGVGQEFDQNGIVACQINAEIHSGHTNFKERFAAVMKGLLNDRRYAIFKVP